LFSELFATYAAPLLGHYLSEPVALLFTAPGSAAVSVPCDTAILGGEKTEESDGEDGRQYRQVLSITFFRRYDSPFTAADPPIGSVLSVDDIEYAVDMILKSNASAVEVRLVRRGVAEVSRPGYRRK
jgi:hypothetical protein